MQDKGSENREEIRCIYYEMVIEDLSKSLSKSDPAYREHLDKTSAQIRQVLKNSQWSEDVEKCVKLTEECFEQERKALFERGAFEAIQFLKHAGLLR